MDFDDLDDAEADAEGQPEAPSTEELEFDLKVILESTNCPDAFTKYLQREGVVTRDALAKHVKAVLDEAFKRECDEIASRLDPPATTSKEMIAIRNAVRRCRSICGMPEEIVTPKPEPPPPAPLPRKPEPAAKPAEAPLPRKPEPAAKPAEAAPAATPAPAAAAAAAEPPAAQPAEAPQTVGQGGLFDDLDELEASEEAAAAQAAKEAPAIEAAETGEKAHPAAFKIPYAWDGGNDTRPYKCWLDEYWDRCMRGEVGYEAPGQPELPPEFKSKDFEARKEVVWKNIEEMMKMGVKPLSPFQKKTMNDLEKLTKVVINGEMYGLPVPVNLDDLKKRGEKFLTQCLHAAGTLPKDNSVKRITEFKRLPMTGQLAAGGSGPKAFLTIQWAKEDPNLHTELFVKMPWDMGSASCKQTGNADLTPKEQEQFYKNKENGIDPYYRWKCSATADYEAQESTIYRFLGPVFPFRIPKYYFADICRDNTNYLLITEKIAYPKKGAKKEFKAWDILPVAEKYFDFQLQPRMQYEMYYCIMRAQARMAAWDKLHYFDATPPEMRGMGMAPPPFGTFEWPPKLPPKRRAAKLRGGEGVAKLWTEFLTDKGKHIYDKKFQAPDFLEALCNCMREFVGYKDEIFLYSCMFPEMIALQHTNLQSDNAYYWYTDEDEMDAGLIDWGGASPGPFTSRMSGSITSALGPVLDEHEEGFLRCFIDEYYKECGIKIDYMEFWRQWMLWYCNYIYSMGSNIEMEIFRETPRDMWKGIKSMWDDKAVGRWNVRCYVFMINHALEYLHLRWERKGKGRLHCHEVFLEWKEYWEGKGMT